MRVIGFDGGVEIITKLEKWDKIYVPPLSISVGKIHHGNALGKAI